MQINHDFLVIRFCGDSGDGIQLIGQQLMMNAAMNDLEVRTLPDFPAEIRAPAGTISGISGMQLALATHRIETAGDKVNILVAMNPAALIHSLPDLEPQAIIFINECQFTAKDWAKAKSQESLLQELQQQYRIISVPVIEHTLKALEHLDVKSSSAKKSKNFFILGMTTWLFELPLDTGIQLIQKHFKSDSLVSETNVMTFTAGFHYGMTQDWQRPYFFNHEEHLPQGEFRQINGAEAIGLALATLATELKTEIFVAGYPITPSSIILHEAARLQAFGIHLFQAEDEIAAICACLGAAYGGHLALTTTSGPGFDLKMEGMGLGVVAELPVVILDVQRAGASTGLPTKTSQSDLRQALYGRHGESPVPVLAAKSPTDCFNTIIEAFRIAVDRMTPVVVLLDAYLMNASEPWKIPDPQQITLPKLHYYQEKEPFKRVNNGSRSWNPPGNIDYIHQLGGLEKQGDWGKVSYDAQNHEHMNLIRLTKLQHIDFDSAYEFSDSSDNLNLFVSWGSTYGIMKLLVDELNQQETSKISWLHLRYLNPLAETLDTILKSYSNVLVFELNSGQLCDLIRSKFLVDAKSIHQCNGKPFSYELLLENTKKHIL